MPLDQETIDNQFNLLATRRRTLAHLLQQAAQFGGEVFAPPQTANGIAEARTDIQRIKAYLRDNGAPGEPASVPLVGGAGARRPGKFHKGG
jgi:hypothetical protein